MNSSIQEKAQQTTDYLFDLLTSHGQENYYGEDISKLAHMAQAAELARQQGHEDAVILAALFHDIGHFFPLEEDDEKAYEQMEEFGTVDHETLGAKFLLKLGFTETTANLIQNHVEAKRYLTYQYPKYYESLSEASRQTLEYQGGRMEKKEAQAFEADPLFELYIQLRKWDEEAKRTDIPLPDLEVFKKICKRHLTQTLTKSSS